MKKTLLGAAIAVLSSSVVYAQDYQFEVSGAYINGDNGNNDFDTYGLNAKLHLDKVDTSKGPLNEAAFLDKSSSLDLSWETSKEDFSGAKSKDNYGIGGRFVTGKNIIIEAEYIDLDGGKTQKDDSAIKVGVGTYINNNMDVVVSYQDYDKKDESTLAVDMHGLHKLKGQTALAFDLGLAYIDTKEDAYRFSAGADYYLNNAFSIGAGVAYQAADDEDKSVVDIRADYFVTPIARIGVSYESEGEDADGDAIQLNASVRF